MLTRAIVFCSLGLAISGCASFDGVQEPVLKSDAAAQIALDDYGLASALTQIEEEDNPAAYRNKVLSVWLMAIDARYDAFRRDLSRGRKGSAVGLDVLTLGLTAGGAMVTDAAQELAAIATGVGGARASFDKELYFDRTLPVLVGHMDAERLKHRARIIKGMKSPISSYSLEEGFADLWQYQSSGSLDRAIAEAASEAASQAKAAEYDFESAVDLCAIDRPTDLAQRKLLRELEALAKQVEDPDASKAADARKHLQNAATQAGATSPPLATKREEAIKQLMPIRDLIEKQCDEAAVSEFSSKLRAAGVPVT